MTPAYLAHFELREPPFSKELSDADLWLPPSKLSLVEELCEALHQRASISLVGDTAIRRLNRTWRRKDKPTDVLSFPQAEFRQPEKPARPFPAQPAHRVL